LIIGACIYGAFALFGTPEEDFRDTTIIVDANRIDAFIGQWESRWNRPPTRQEIDGIIQQYVREDILYRQAVAMGLNEDDPITRRRMAQKLEFLTSDLAMMKQPAEGELEQYFQDNQEKYKAPDQISFSQVFFDPDAREEATLDDAAEVLVQLRSAGEPDAQTLEAGDQFMLQGHFPSVTEADIARTMGSGFAQAVMQLEPGQWHGPVLSGYGVHLVYVYDFQAASPPVFQDVQATVLEDWHAVQREEFNAAFFEALKKNYDIIIDEVPADRLIDGAATTISKDDSGAGGVAAS
jgi:hypothetical protein